MIVWPQVLVDYSPHLMLLTVPHTALYEPVDATFVVLVHFAGCGERFFTGGTERVFVCHVV